MRRSAGVRVVIDVACDLSTLVSNVESVPESMPKLELTHPADASVCESQIYVHKIAIANICHGVQHNNAIAARLPPDNRLTTVNTLSDPGVGSESTTAY